MNGEDALNRLRDAWEKTPGSLAFVPLAEALRRRGDLDEAITVSRSGLDARPNHSSAHLVLGRCLFDKGDFSEAIREFEEVVSLDPKNALALRMLGLALKGKGWGREDAVSDARGDAVAVATETRARVSVSVGVAVAVADSVEEIEFFTRTMAEILERQGFHRKALEIYEKLAVGHPERADLRERIVALKAAMERAQREEGREA